MPKPPIRKPKKKVCAFCKDKTTYIDYKDTSLLRKYISDGGMIRARGVTGNGSQHQRDVGVAVKDGYGRNYLVPRGLALGWTKGGEKQIAQIRRARDARDVRDLGEAQQLRNAIEGREVTLTARAGSGGRLFGSITAADIVEAVKAAGGPELDRRRVELPGHIKTTGSHTATVRLHPEVSAKINLQVVPS